MMAYLVEMAVRLVELHRVLKPTGSLYLHCDPTASHYLKLLLDAIFGPRTSATRSSGSGSDAPTNDAEAVRPHPRRAPVLRQGRCNLERPPAPACRASEYVEDEYGRTSRPARAAVQPRRDDPRTRAGEPGGNRLSTSSARCDLEAVLALRLKGAWTRSFRRGPHRVLHGPAVPEYKRYLDEMPGQPVQDIWDDIDDLRWLARTSASDTRRRSLSPSSNGSSRRRRTRATSCSIRSAAAAPRSWPPRSSTASGSGSTSPTSRSRS